MLVKATTIAALARLFTIGAALQLQQPLNHVNEFTGHEAGGAAGENQVDNIFNAQDGPVAALVTEKIEFLGYVNDSQVFDSDCRQWPSNGEAVTIGEVWWENDSWYAQRLKMWNHRHAFEWGLCIETRFGWDTDPGAVFYAQKGTDVGDDSVWNLKAYKNFAGKYEEGVVGWNADKARWIPCTDFAGCGGGSVFAMNKRQCFRARIKSGRVVQVCKTYTNDGNRICGEYSRKHHGRYRCGTGRDSHYWFGTESGCMDN